jgi:hypothetical protein
MKKPGLFTAWAFAAAALLFFVVVVHLRFAALPVAFLALGFVSYAWNGRKALQLFLLLLPLVNSTPDLFFNGYPFNYMGIPLFHLAGMLCASRMKKEDMDTAFPGRGPYLLFLSLLAISVVFVFLRWSNLGLSALAFLRDTPVAPSMERVSFACIFPAITLALFALAPWAAFLLHHWRLREAQVFVPLKVGLSLSFLLALGQKWIDPGFMSQSWWGLKMKQLNGGFSDFNAFGFFAGAMFLYQALQLMERLPVKPRPAEAGGVAAAAEAAPASRGFSGGILAADLLFLAVALAAVLVSGCRSAFLFVLAALLRLFLSRRPGWRLKAAAVVLLATALLIAGGTLGRRLRHSLAQTARLQSIADLPRAVDTVSNNRLEMLRDGGRLIGLFPGSGVGAGNFLFALKYLRFGEVTWLDLPLNQYLLVFSETGLPGGLAFLLFLAGLLRRLKPGKVRFILAVMAFALLFNNFFWFPEVLLLFWIIVARGEWQAAPGKKNATVLAVALVLLFIVLNGAAFQALHPRTWARKAATPYDYGFSYLEKENGREFRWSGEDAGTYIYPGAAVDKYRLYCGAPLAVLPGRSQRVDVFWRGRSLQRVIFRENGEYFLHNDGRDRQGGFLELRVRPAFNLQRLGLGNESRDLGIQISGPGN